MLKFSRGKVVSLAVILLLTSITVLIACRRFDRSFEQNNEQRFFSLPAGTHPSVKEISLKIYEQNQRYHFVNDLVNRVGFPRWDKASITITSPDNQMTRIAGGDNAQYVFIPFWVYNMNRVSSVLAIKTEGDSSWYKLVYPEEYSLYGFNYSGGSKINARGILNLFAYFSNVVFGYEEFVIKDEKLLTPTDQQWLSDRRLNFEDVQVYFTIKDTTEQHCENCSLASPCLPVAICFVPEGSTPCSTCNSSCSYFAGYSSCTSGWAGNIFEPDPGSPAGSDTGTGGGGGSAGWWEDPCEEDPSGDGRVEPCDGILGWEPVEDNPPIEDPCVIAQNVAKNMDSIYIKSNVDSVLGTITGFDTLSVEKGYAIYKKISVNPYNVTDTTITGYRSGTIISGNSTGVTISIGPGYLELAAASLHTHPPRGYTAQSAADVYSLIQGRMDWNYHYAGTFVAASDGSKYAITITDYAKASAFFSTKSNYLDTTNNGWIASSVIGKAFKEAYDDFEKLYKGNPNKKNLAYEMAMAAVLSQFNTGITLNKKDPLSGNFKPLVVNTAIPNPNKPKKKVYTQYCL